MTILDGKSLSQEIQENLKQEIAALTAAKARVPRLVVILVGNDAPSRAYVNMKAKACEKIGMQGEVLEFDEGVEQVEILQEIERLNKDSSVDGVLVQLPLPRHFDTALILESIAPSKDVDGFHPLNVGRIECNTNQNLAFSPATPLGVMTLLKHYDIEVSGKNVAIVGASNIVGKPLAALMLNAGATISICHILTRDVALYTREADIVCVGVGKPNLITADMVKEGAIIVDIGINRLDDGRLVGDVEFEPVSKKASLITPVPGGVGPMTIATLLQNTLKAYRLRESGK